MTVQQVLAECRDQTSILAYLGKRLQTFRAKLTPMHPSPGGPFEIAAGANMKPVASQRGDAAAIVASSPTAQRKPTR